MDPSVITDWDKLRSICEQIANIDFSNVEEIANTKTQFEIDPASIQQEASKIYNIYEDIIGKVHDIGDTISPEQYEGLSDSLKEYFRTAADGSYVLYRDA